LSITNIVTAAPVSVRATSSRATGGDAACAGAPNTTAPVVASANVASSTDSRAAFVLRAFKIMWSRPPIARVPSTPTPRTGALCHICWGITMP
jgi:hypothetical protein